MGEIALVRLLKDESLVSQWQKFFEDHLKSDIETVSVEYPDKKSLFVDYWKIDELDSKLAETLLNQPYKSIFNAEEALKNIDATAENKLELHFRVINLSDTNKILIRKIRSNHLGKLIELVERAKKVAGRVYILKEIAPLQSGFGEGVGGVNWTTELVASHVPKIIEQLENTEGAARVTNVGLIDVNSESLVPGTSYGKRQYVDTHDGIHPSVEGHILTANVIARTIDLP